MKKMKSETVMLDTVEKCRQFIKSARLGPNSAKIKFLTQADGTQVSIDRASDAQIIQVATEIAEALNGVRTKELS